MAFRTHRLVASAIAALGIGVLTACVPPPGPPGPAGPAGPAGSAVAAAHAQAVGGYGYEPGLDGSAQAAADRVSAGGSCGSLSHTPGVNENLFCWDYGEVVGCPPEQAMAEAAVNAWMASGQHLANIQGHSVVGGGIACNGRHFFVAAHYL